jgi:hypothetical protein
MDSEVLQLEMFYYEEILRHQSPLLWRREIDPLAPWPPSDTTSEWQGKIDPIRGVPDSSELFSSNDVVKMLSDLYQESKTLGS